MWGKKKIDVLPDIKSQDKYNRSAMPKNIKIPTIQSNKGDKKYIIYGIQGRIFCEKDINDCFSKSKLDTFQRELNNKRGVVLSG